MIVKRKYSECIQGESETSAELTEQHVLWDTFWMHVDYRPCLLHKYSLQLFHDRLIDDKHNHSETWKIIIITILIIYIYIYIYILVYLRYMRNRMLAVGYTMFFLKKCVFHDNCIST